MAHHREPFTEKALDETRAALAPTLEATAAILPWVAKPQPVRFPPELNIRWQEACARLDQLWKQGHTSDPNSIRPAIFSLLSIALETADVDCLQLAETLASTADRFEEGPPSARMKAALTSTIECLLEEGGLENQSFGNHARHFSQRLKSTMQPSNKPGERSDVLDQIFVSDAQERLERMYEALEVLPIDIYALTIESRELTEQAEQIDMWGIVHLGRQIENFVLLMGESGEAAQDHARGNIEVLLDSLAQLLKTVDS